MTYLEFHLVFTIPPILLMVAWMALRLPHVLKAAPAPIAAIAVIAVVYTTPWDNYLVYREVWGYGAERVLGTIGHVPIEEYAFFVLQTILTGLLLLLWASRTSEREIVRDAGLLRMLGTFGLLLITGAGAYALFSDSTLYLGLILAWAFPILALQWALGARYLMQWSPVWMPVVAVATLYLGTADAIAIRSGTWHISETYTTGISILSLPLEEGLFFLVTNLLVTWGVILFIEFRRNRLSEPRPTP